MHSEQTGNDRLLCLLKGFLICHCEQGSISYHVKKLDWVCKFSGRSPRLKSLSNSLVEHFNYWPGLCLGPGVQSSSLLHDVSLNLLISVDAPAFWARWARGPDVIISCAAPSTGGDCKVWLLTHKIWDLGSHHLH